MSAYDVLILGSSPNALAAAARLAKHGRKVLVLEARGTFGGPVATDIFAPGFRADTGVMSVALDEEITRELKVEVEVLRRDCITATGPSPRTLRAAPELPEAVSHAVGLLRAMYRTQPPHAPAPAGADSTALGELAAHLSKLGNRPMHEVLRLLFLPVRDFVEELALAPDVRGLLAGVALRAVSEGPFAAGTLFGYLHHAALNDGLFRSSAVGGVQRLAQALADRARALGAELRAGVAGAQTIHVENGVARGVRLAGGEPIFADTVISDHDARATFTRLVSPAELGPEVNRVIAATRYRGSVARVHLALNDLPRFAGVEPAALRGTVVLAPDTAALERAWDQAKRGVMPDRPHVELTLPTVADPGLAPAGQHVLSAWIQYVPHGRGKPGAVLKAVVDLLEAAAPGIRELIAHHHVALPEDLESRFGLTGGHLYGGEVRLDQAFFLRPIPGFGHYETPIERLYLCGSAAHPGGYSGRSGWNLAGHLLSAAGASATQSDTPGASRS